MFLPGCHNTDEDGADSLGAAGARRLSGAVKLSCYSLIDTRGAAPPPQLSEGSVSVGRERSPENPENRDHGLASQAPGCYGNLVTPTGAVLAC